MQALLLFNPLPKTRRFNLNTLKKFVKLHNDVSNKIDDSIQDNDFKVTERLIVELDDLNKRIEFNQKVENAFVVVSSKAKSRKDFMKKLSIEFLRLSHESKHLDSIIELNETVMLEVARKTDS